MPAGSSVDDSNRAQLEQTEIENHFSIAHLPRKSTTLFLCCALAVSVVLLKNESALQARHSNQTITDGVVAASESDGSTSAPALQHSSEIPTLQTNLTNSDLHRQSAVPTQISLSVAPANKKFSTKMDGTRGGCFESKYLFVHNGGFRKLNASFVTLLVLPRTNLTVFRENISACSGALPHVAAIEIVIHISVESNPPPIVLAAVWRFHPHAPYHGIYRPGIFWVHSIFARFTSFHGLPQATLLRTIFVDGDAPPRIPPIVKIMHKMLDVRYSHSRMHDGAQVVTPSRIFFAHSRAFENIDWKLINETTKAVAFKLQATFPDTPVAVDGRRVFVEKRAFSHRLSHQQFRGYRPAVWSVIASMAARNNLKLDIVDLGKRTFKQQWQTLRTRKYVIATEGSFSVWFPFLRKGTVCLMIYDHYGSGWLIPTVHLPMALLGDRIIKLVFISIFNSSIPSEETIGTALLGDFAPQVSVVTVPYDAKLQQNLSTFPL
ncbi:Hypothetical protein, putative [Bodo saltans]|uniref:Uncharacterized protein n=1 Tax=Bodo saltans TaxID=75058 RepID=A0A0S4IZL8_BODSA|nr:Hypothetical protein, putative [Bodo saltans]|eukprot:CUG04309.1 Hypothetical protein, putative [Bodo saltans]